MVRRICKSTHLIRHIFRRLLPDWLPFHPSRWWIHTRTVYVPMGYLYGVRFKATKDPLILALREVGYYQYVLQHRSCRISYANRNSIPNLMIRSTGPPSEIMSPKRTSIHLTKICSISSPGSLVHTNSALSRLSAMPA